MHETNSPDSAGRPRIAGVGCGNVLMGDDGIGPALIDTLRKSALPENVDLYDAGTALPDVLSLIGSCDRLVIVDTCRADGEPGSVYRSVCRPEELTARPLGDSSHGLGVVHAVQMHCLAGGEIGELVILGVEPSDVSLRDGLSPVLRQRLPAIVDAILNELRVHSETRQGGEA